MKKQINIGNGNKQTSDDDTTTQVQIGTLGLSKPVYFICIILGIIFYRSCIG